MQWQGPTSYSDIPGQGIFRDSVVQELLLKSADTSAKLIDASTVNLPGDEQGAEITLISERKRVSNYLLLFLFRHHTSRYLCKNYCTDDTYTIHVLKCIFYIWWPQLNQKVPLSLRLLFHLSSVHSSFHQSNCSFIYFYLGLLIWCNKPFVIGKSCWNHLRRQGNRQ